MSSTQHIEKVVIVGSGPAGYTAAIYTARAMLNPLMITGPIKGGQLISTTDVENFPGYPKGVLGPTMMNDLEEQASRFGTRVVIDYVEKIDTSSRPFTLTCIGGEVKAYSIIISTGAEAKWLNVPGEKALKSRGISTCATCDGAFFRGEELVVIGGGDSAMEEAIFLTRYATKVTVIHRRDIFRASRIMLERARDNSKISWKKGTIASWVTKNGELSSALVQTEEGQEKVPCTGAFIAIGHKPSTSFLDDSITTDADGYIKHVTNTMTSVPGIFACGDVCVSSKRYKQAVTAAAEGCKAAMDCEKWLEEQDL